MVDTVEPLPITERPVAYHQLLRGPTLRWWRPPLGLPVLLIGLVVGVAVATLTVVGYAVATGRSVEAMIDEAFDIESGGPASFYLTNLILIAALPATALSVWAVHRIRPGHLSSVAGHLRWRWMAGCAIVVVPLWAAYVGVLIATNPGAVTVEPQPDHWLVLLIMVVLMTPFQAAAEEYLFRGWLVQNVGSYFGSERLGFLVSVIVSAGLFALAHGSLNLWVFADLFVFATAASVLAWRTGGLEAGIALHVVNNLGALGLVLAFGGWDTAFVGETSTSTPLVLTISLVFHAAVVAVVLWRARRAGLSSRFQPA